MTILVGAFFQKKLLFCMKPAASGKTNPKEIGGIIMCTAIQTGSRFFGRTLDVERSYDAAAVRVPRGCALTFLHEATVPRHPAMIGVGIVQDGMPLYFDAANEAGLCAAGLRFHQSAVYLPPRAGMHNVASFELIPWLLSRCKTLREAAALLARTNITAESVSESLPAEPLHWIVADRTGTIVAEPLAGGLAVAENPFGVLSNEPSFGYHAAHMAALLHLSPDTPGNTFCPSAAMTPFGGGLGAVGLPGDFSSPSRFARAVFARAHAGESVRTAGDFFRLTDIVTVPRGCVRDEAGRLMHTAWASCYEMAAGTLYVTSAACRRIAAAALPDADAAEISAVPFAAAEDVRRLE